MIWNELNYDIQKIVIDKIVDLLKEENNSLTQDAIIAAVHELQIWSNSPIDNE